MALTAEGNRIALPIDAALGRKPCCAACVQKVAKSGGRTTPVMMSHSAARKAEICAEKSSCRFS
jgi:Na+-transporting NADH:ubiquinone oxidoreductase subunit NqrF